MPELNHLGLAVRNPARSLRFYRETIGVDGVVSEEEYGFVITTTKGVGFTLFKGSLPPTTESSTLACHCPTATP